MLKKNIRIYIAIYISILLIAIVFYNSFSVTLNHGLHNKFDLHTLLTVVEKENNDAYKNTVDRTQLEAIAKNTELINDLFGGLNKINKSELHHRILYELEKVELHIFREERNQTIFLCLIACLVGVLGIVFYMDFICNKTFKHINYIKDSFLTKKEDTVTSQLRVIQQIHEENTLKLEEQIKVNLDLSNNLTQQLEEQVRHRTEEILQKNEEIITQRDELERKQAIISAKNKDLMDSITYARQIQDATLVGRSETISHFKDAFILYKPRDVISGDFYWFTHYRKKLIFAVADCTGHGVPGAFLTMMGNSILNQIVLKDHIHDPGEILTKLNIDMMNSYRKVRKNLQIRDGMDISIVQINNEDMSITFAAAKHQLLWLRNNEEMKILSGQNISIGGSSLSPDILKFESQKIYSQSGDRFYMFTDGFPDQFGGTKGKKYMRKNFRNLIQNTVSSTMIAQKELLANELGCWRGEHDQTDDILVVGWEM